MKPPIGSFPDPTTGQEAVTKAYGDANYAGGGGGGAVIASLEYMDKIIVGADSTKLTFGAGGDGELGTALDGDTDDTYIIKALLRCDDLSTYRFTLRPNDIAMTGSVKVVSGGSQSNETFGTFAEFINDYGVFEITFDAKTGNARSFKSTGYTADDSGINSGHALHDYAGSWADTSTNITSMVIESQTALKILAGSEFVLYRRRPLNGSLTTAGETLITSVGDVGTDSHDSATPKVVSQFSFDPTDHAMNGATLSLRLRAVASNGGGVTTTHVQLYNLTDAEAISTLNFTSASPVLVDELLTIGSGAGEVDESPKLYEIRIYVDSPDMIDDTIELGSAELRVINTVN